MRKHGLIRNDQSEGRDGVQAVIRGRILGRLDPEDNQWRLEWCYINIDGTIKVWQLDIPFSNVLECFAYGKNLILQHVADKGRPELADHIEWWLKGHEQYCCPHCLNFLDLQGKANQDTFSEVLHLTFPRCHSEMRIPVNAFTFSSY